MSRYRIRCDGMAGYDQSDHNIMGCMCVWHIMHVWYLVLFMKGKCISDACRDGLVVRCLRG